MLKFSHAKTDELKGLIETYFEEHKLNQQSSAKFIVQVKGLIDNGANPGVTFLEINNTPLLAAILKGDVALCEALIEADEHGRSINKKDTYEIEACNTPLILAIKRALYDIALSLINHGANVNEPSGYQGYTALHFATALLGTQYQRQDTSRSDFHADADDPNKKLIKLIMKLVTAGADVTTENAFGKTPLDYLSHKFTEDEIETRVYLPTETMLLAASAKVSLDLAAMYLNKKYDYTNEINQFKAEVEAEAEFDVWIAGHEQSEELHMLRQADKANEAINREMRHLECKNNWDDYDAFIRRNAAHYAAKSAFYPGELAQVLEKLGLPEISLDDLVKKFYVLEAGADLCHSRRNHAESIVSAVIWHHNGDDLRDELIYRRKEYFEDNPMVQGKLAGLFSKALAREEASELTMTPG